MQFAMAGSAATLTQQEKNNSADLQQGGFSPRGNALSASSSRWPKASRQARHCRSAARPPQLLSSCSLLSCSSHCGAGMPRQPNARLLLPPHRRFLRFLALSIGAIPKRCCQTLRFLTSRTENSNSN
jgi:hypothetical protein